MNKNRPADWLITWPSTQGPMVRRFACPVVFEGYIKSWKQHAGPQSVSWLTPFIVQAHA